MGKSIYSFVVLVLGFSPIGLHSNQHISKVVAQDFKFSFLLLSKSEIISRKHDILNTMSETRPNPLDW
jgi:hypothetical protein